jgi:hypothetical protein
MVAGNTRRVIKFQLSVALQENDFPSNDGQLLAELMRIKFQSEGSKVSDMGEAVEGEHQYFTVAVTMATR